MIARTVRANMFLGREDLEGTARRHSTSIPLKDRQAIDGRTRSQGKWVGMEGIE